jgi:hypothetical protein
MVKVTNSRERGKWKMGKGKLWAIFCCC